MEEEEQEEGQNEKVVAFISLESFNELCTEYGYQPANEQSENDEVYQKCMHKLDKTLRRAMQFMLVQADDANQSELTKDCVERVKASVKILK